MHLKTIQLRQFRNHRQLDLTVFPGVNLFLGPNGAGKTNLLEAIAVLATGLSPRGAETENMVQWGENGFFIKGVFGSENDQIEPLALEMKYVVGASRVVRQNGQVAVRIKDLVGRVPIVGFVPEDLALVKGEPELRRRAMNLVLVQSDPLYAETLKRYNEALKSRNAALRQLNDGAIPASALDPWDEAVIEFGLRLCRKRAEFLFDFSPRASFVQQQISGGQETLHLEYRPSFEGPWDESSAQRWRERMNQTKMQDLALGSTSVGPHRDDILFSLNDRAAKSYGSEGQKRTCAVAFKLAEMSYLEQKLKQKPLCLLDDVLSELDAQRAEHLLNELSRTGQCFVTLTGLESWPKSCRRPAVVFHVSEAGIQREQPLNESFDILGLDTFSTRN